MEYQKSRKPKKLYEGIPLSIFGLFSVLAGVIGDFISFLLSPGYDMRENMISDLGMGPGGLFFNFGVIISGILAIPYFLYLGDLLLNSEDENSPWVKVAIAGSVISSIALSLIGVFPADSSRPVIFLIHGTIATICYVGAVIYLIIYGKYMLKDDRFNNVLAYLAFLTAFLFIIVLFTWLPSLQWFANISIITWTTLVALYLYFQKI